jgi:hypothetical protein
MTTCTQTGPVFARNRGTDSRASKENGPERGSLGKKDAKIGIREFTEPLSCFGIFEEFFRFDTFSQPWIAPEIGDWKKER